MLGGALVVAFGYGLYAALAAQAPVMAPIIGLVLAILGVASAGKGLAWLLWRPAGLVIDRDGITVEPGHPGQRIAWSELKGAHMAVMAGQRSSMFIPRSWSDVPIIALELADPEAFHRAGESARRPWLGYDTGVRPDYVPIYYGGLDADGGHLMYLVQEGIRRQGRPAPDANPQTTYDLMFVGDALGRVGLAVLIFFVALTVAVIVALRPPSWLEVRPGCDVRNFYDGKEWRRATTSVTWNGPCVDGRAQGRGVIEWFRDGRRTERYEGEMSKGRMTGRGEMTTSWRPTERGVFEDGFMTEGTAEYPGGGRYEGKWYRGRWTKGVFTAPGGRRMDGRWYEGRMSGIGIAQGPEGRYEGNWYRGLPEGKGVFVTPSGERYEGKWHEGKLVEPASGQFKSPSRPGVPVDHGGGPPWRRVCRSWIAAMREQTMIAGDAFAF